MPLITFIDKDGNKTEIEATSGFSLMQVAKDNDIEGVEAVCGGCLSCATCHLYIHPDWMERVSESFPQNDDEVDMLDMAFDVTDYSRLSCQIEITDDMDGLVVGLPGAAF